MFAQLISIVVITSCSAFLTKPILSSLHIKSIRTSSIMMSSKSYSVGIVGATGAVGEELLSVMEKRNFPCNSIKLFASEKSAGKTISSSVYGSLVMEKFTFEAAIKLDVVLLAVGGDFSLEWAEKLANAGVLVIDNSSAFRMKEGIPLVIPEINIDAAKKGNKKLIANPNCTTAIALMALWPIHQKYKIKKAIISTYQAASGAGAEGMQELKDGIASTVKGDKVVNKIFAHPLPYNIIPHIDVFQSNMYTKEEMKVS
jgi:aspartate-semialdehyde dehydrogenase